MNILRNSICFLLIGFVCAQERSISGATSRRNRFSAGKPQAVNFNCPEDFGYYAHPTDCSQYYVCVFGGALLESCTGGLMYSTELQTCDWPRNVVCKASSGPGVSTVKITDPRTRSTDTNSIHSATESLSSSSIVSRGVDNTIRNTQPLKSSGISKAIFEDPSEGRQGRFVTIQEDPHQRIDNGFQAQETSSRAFNVVPSAAATPNSKLTFPWKSDMKRKSRRRRDLNRGRQFDSSSSAPEKLLSLFDVSSFKNPFDISFSSSALLSAGPRERTNREIRKKKTVLPPEASFISSSFVNPFKPRHQRRGPFRHYEQIPNVSFRNQHSQFDNDKKRNSFGSHFPPQGPPMPTFKNQLTSKVHTQKRPIYPDKRHREQEFHPPMSFPVHLQRDRFRSSGGSGPNESPKSIGTSNFAIDFHRPDLPELKNSPFSNNFKNFKQDFDSHFYRDDDFENDDKSQYQDEYYDVSPNDNDRPFQHNEQVNSHPNTYTSNDHLSNSQRDFYEDYGDRTHEKNPHFNRHTNDFNNDNNDRPNFKPLPVLHPTHDTEEYQNYDYVEQDHLKLTPPVVEDAVLLTPTEDYQELQNISEEKDQIEGKHIEGDFSPNHLEDFPPNHLEDFSPNHLIANNQINTPRTKTRRKPSTKTIKSPRPSLTTPEPQPEPTPFQTTPQPPSTLPSRMPVPKFGQKTFKKQTLRRPPQIPGTARHPELSKLNVKHDDSPSLPGQSRFPSVRSSTTSPKSDNLYADILNSNDTDYYYYYDDILYDDYYDQTAKKTTTKAPVVRSSSRSRGKKGSKKSAVSSSGLGLTTLNSRGRGATNSRASSSSSNSPQPSSQFSSFNNPDFSSSFPNTFAASRFPAAEGEGSSSTKSLPSSSSSSNASKSRKNKKESSRTAPSRGTSRNKPKAPSKSSPQPGAKPQLVGRTPQRLVRPSKKPLPASMSSGRSVDIWKYPPRR